MTRIKESEPLAAGLLRAVNVQVDTCLATIEPAVNETVRETRVCGKKLRAYLALMRKSLGSFRYNATDSAIREMTRSLRAFREADVDAGLLDRFHCAYPDTLTSQHCDRLQRALSDAHVEDREAILAKIRNDVEAERISLDLLPIEIKWDDILTALVRSYAQFRNAQANALHRPSPLNIDAWRKRCQRLEFQIRLFDRVTPKSVRELGHRLRRLSNQLGEAQDLLRLKVRLHELKAPDIETARQVARKLIQQNLRPFRRAFMKADFGSWQPSKDSFQHALRRKASRLSNSPVRESALDLIEPDDHIRPVA